MIKSQKENLIHLKASFEEKNEKEFKFLLETYAYNVNVSLSTIGIESSLIEYILSTPKSSNFIKICLKNGKSFHKKNSRGFYLLDYAIKSLCADNLKTLVDHLNMPALKTQTQQMISCSEIPNNNNLLHNVLHSLSTENKEECKKIIEILLKNGCNPNHFNAEHITPFEFLLNKIQNDKLGSDLIEIFLANSIQCIEISDSKFNRNLVTDINSEKLIIRIRSIADIAHLIDLINQGNENEFIESLQKTEISIQVPNNFTELMKRCIEMNFVKGTKMLFHHTPQNIICIGTGYEIDSLILTGEQFEIYEKPLLFYAIKLCRPKIVKVFLNQDNTQFKSDQHNYSVLHEICSMKNVECDKDFQKCFELIIKDRRCDYKLINGFDYTGKTPLMHACENDHKGIIYELLRRGAYIGHECIINNLCEDTLKRFLDECIIPTSDISDQNCAVQISYKFLIPPKYSLNRNDETRALKLLASQTRFKKLMTHPVLTSYLELKWKRVNILVYVALFLYFIFFVYLSLFILNFFSNDLYNGNAKLEVSSRFGVDNSSDKSSPNQLANVDVLGAIFGRRKRDVYTTISDDIIFYPTEESETTSQTPASTSQTTEVKNTGMRNHSRGTKTTTEPQLTTTESPIEVTQGYNNLTEYIASNRINYSICLIGTLILTLCEIVQFIFGWRTYFLKLSNWVDCALLFLAYVVLFNFFAYDVELFRKLRAVLFLVISVQSFILLSRVSKLSLQLEIFKKVSKTFLKFIMLYFMLLFAFAMAFNTLYGGEIPVQKSEDDLDKVINKNKPKHEDDDDENGFQNILISIITVIRMMLSDFDKMKLDPQDMFNSIIFLTFVILITIILFNLLNALAINDTQQIMKSAEIVDVRKRIGMVGNCEQILAYLKIEFFNIYSNLIHNGRIILKINKDNYVRILSKTADISLNDKLNIIENEYINMVPICDDNIEISPKRYTKVRIPQLIPYEKLYTFLEKYDILDLNLSLGNENVEKIINHIKYSIDSDN